MNIYSKLTELQNDLKAPKNQYNNFGKYKYRSAEDILEAVKPLLLNLKLTQIISDEIVVVNERYYIKSTVTLYNEEGESVSVSAYAREAENKKGMDESQVTGSASSYARKYALNGLYAIDDTKDSDTDEYYNQTNKNSNTKTQSKNKAELEKEKEKRLNELFDLVAKRKINPNDISQLIKNAFNKNNSKELEIEEIDQLIKMVEVIGK